MSGRGVRTEELVTLQKDERTENAADAWSYECQWLTLTRHQHLLAIPHSVILILVMATIIYSAFITVSSVRINHK